MAGRKPDYDVCVSKRNEDKSPSRALQVGAAWEGDKRQLNVKLEITPSLMKAFLEDEYQFVLFPREDSSFDEGSHS